MNKKPVQIIVCIFAAIGLVAVIGGAVFLGVSAVKKSSKNAEASSETVKEETLESTIENYSAKEKETEEESTASESADASATPSPTPAKSYAEYGGTIELEDGKPLMVFLGDTVYDYHRDGATSIPNLIGERCNANVINLAMEDCPASTAVDADEDDPKSYAHTGIGVAEAMAGLRDVDTLDDSPAKEIIKDNPDIFAQTDVFVISYGIYDFLYDHATNVNDYPEAPWSYEAAIRRIIKAIETVAPEAKIVLMRPTYCEFVYGDNNEFYGSNQDYRRLYGTLFDYANKLDGFDDLDGKLFKYNTEGDDGLNQYSAAECLEEDGINLTETGRRKYTDIVGGYINRNIFKTEAPRQ